MAESMNVAETTVEALDSLSLQGATINAVAMYLIGLGGHLEVVVGGQAVRLLDTFKR